MTQQVLNEQNATLDENQSSSAKVIDIQPVNGQLETDAKEIDLMQLLHALRKKLLWIILAAVLGAGIAGIYTHFFCTPQYKSKAVVYLVSTSNSTLNLSDLQLSSGIADDYAILVKSRSVLLTVADNLGLDYSYTQMTDLISVETPTNSHMLNIYATCSNPEQAKRIANEAAYVSIRKIAEIMEISTPNIIDEAVVPSAPISPSLPRNVLIGLLLGAVLVGGFFILQFVLNRTVTSAEDIERYCGLVTLTRVYASNSKQAYGRNSYSAYYAANGASATPAPKTTPPSAVHKGRKKK